MPMISSETDEPKKVNDDFDLQQILETHPAFASTVDPESDDPGFAGLQALKYESEDPDANATSYKDEGNYHYARKEFKQAINSYTGGLRAKPNDKKLAAILYTNRAICHSYLKNYGSCIRDCKAAMGLNPEHMKAYIKGAEACLALSKIDLCLEFCERGLERFPDETKLVQFQLDALKRQMKTDQETATKRQVQQNEIEKQVLLYKMAHDHGVRINFKLPPVDVPEAAGAQFYADDAGQLHWSVLFMYPEFGQTDFLRDVVETSSVKECLQLVFDPEQAPPTWDINRVYTCQDDSIEVYFEDSLKEQRLISFPPSTTLKRLTRRKNFCVRRDLLIVIHVISKRSTKFYDRWKAELI